MSDRGPRRWWEQTALEKALTALLLALVVLTFVWTVLLVLPGGRVGLEAKLGRYAVAPWEALARPTATVTAEPTPAGTPTIQPGDCYPVHILPPADEVARVIFNAMGMPPDAPLLAYWQLRPPANDIWIKIFFTDNEGEGILFVDLTCGYWQQGNEYGTQNLRWGEFYIVRPTPAPRQEA